MPKRKFKMTAERLKSARRNIKIAQKARMHKAAERKQAARDLAEAKAPGTAHMEPLLRDVPLRVADKETEVQFWQRREREASQMNLSLTKELEHHRRLANFIDWIMRKS